MEKLQLYYPRFYLEIYHIIDVMHGIKKVKILVDKLDKIPIKKKKKKKKIKKF